jgi:uncharacterized protein YndB with AHSA1/START domain
MKANDDYGRFTGPAEVRIVRTLPGPIERVWEYLTDPEKRSRWFAGGPMELRPGGKMALHFQHKNLAPDEESPEGYKDDAGKTMAGVITRCEPPRVLAFTFGSSGESEATFELTAQGKEVLLVLSHRSRGEDLDYMHEFASGWHVHLGYLLSILEGTPRGPFWSAHARLKVIYNQARIAAQKP